MWVLHLGLGLHLRLFKSPKGYIETNLNMGIAFKETQKKNISLTIWEYFQVKFFNFLFLNIK
jgi:hypothetical protein